MSEGLFVNIDYGGGINPGGETMYWFIKQVLLEYWYKYVANWPVWFRKN